MHLLGQDSGAVVHCTSLFLSWEKRQVVPAAAEQVLEPHCGQQEVHNVCAGPQEDLYESISGVVSLM